MSRFGNRPIPIVPLPGAAPNLGAARQAGEVERALSTALGLGTDIAQTATHFARTGQRLQGLDTQAELARMDTERAGIALQREQVQREETLSRLETEEAAQAYENLREAELFGVKTVVARMGPEMGAKWLAANPAVDPDNDEFIARHLGGRLAQSSLTRIFQSLIEWESDPDRTAPFDVSAAYAAEVQRFPFDSLHPEAKLEFDESLGRQLEHYKRDAVVRQAAVATEWMQRESQSDSVREFEQLMRGEMTYDEYSARDMARMRFIDPPAFGADGKGNGESSLWYETQADKAAAWVKAKLTNGQSPDSIERSLKVLPESIRTRLASRHVDDLLAYKKQQQINVALAEQERTYSAMLADAERAIDPVAIESLIRQIELMPDSPQKARLMSDALSRKTVIMREHGDLLAGLDALYGKAEIGERTLPDGVMDKMYADAVGDVDDHAVVAQLFIGRIGHMPNAWVDRIQTIADPTHFNFNPAGTVHELRAMQQVAASDADRLIDRIGADGGRYVRTLMSATAGLQEGSPEFQRRLSILRMPDVTRKLAQADAALGIGEKPNVDAQNAYQRIGEQFGSDPDAPISNAAVKAFEDQFRWQYIQAVSDQRLGFLDAEGNPDTEHAQKFAQSAAAESLRGQFTALTIDGWGLGNKKTVLLPADRAGVRNDVLSKRSLSNALLDLRSAAADLPVEAEIRPDLVVQYEGNSYYPSITLDPQRGPVVAKLMEWYPGTQSGRLLRETGQDASRHNRVAKIIESGLNPWDADPNWDIARSTGESGVIEEYDAKYYGDDVRRSMGYRTYERSVREWMKLYGSAPNLDDPVELSMFDQMQVELAKSVGWSAIDAPSKGSNSSSKGGSSSSSSKQGGAD